MSIHTDLNNIAELYIKFNLKIEACECYLRGKKFEKAGKLYIKMEMWNEAAEMYFLMGRFEKAADLYCKSNDYLKMMECYENAKDWEAILKVMNQFRLIIPQSDRLSYLKKYFPRILDKLINNVDFEEPNIQSFNKKIDLNGVNAIKEEEEYEDEDYDSDVVLSESEEENEEENEKENEEENKEENEEENEREKEKEKKEEKEEENEEEEIINEKPINENDLNEQEKSVTIMNKPNQTNSIIDNLSFIETDKKEMSFEHIGWESNKLAEKKEMSFEQVDFETNLRNKKQLEESEHLSHIDFDEEWLKSENHSLIDSIMSSREKKMDVKSEYSGFECIDPNSLNPNYHIIKTKGDIFIQDETMKKIIEYLKLFSEDFFTQCKDFRSKEVLLSRMKKNNNTDSVNCNDENFVMDLDNIDMNFLFMILDVLEIYKQYKLCIFVCNRYTLHQRVSRYLISIAHRYSFLANEKPEKLTFSLFYGENFVKYQQEKSFVVSTAIHNVLENINPHYLQFKKRNEIPTNSNDLGLYTFQGLILLGCWKKCVYFMDYQNCLAVTSTFADFANYKYLFLKGHEEYCKHIQENNPNSIKNFISLPFESPKDNLDYEFLKICLKENIWIHANFNDLAVDSKNQTIKILETLKYQSCFELNAVFHEFVLNLNQKIFDKLKLKIEDSLKNFKNIKLKKSELDLFDKLKIFDLISGLTQIIFYLHKKNQNFQFHNALIIEIVEFLLFLIDLLEKFDKSSKYSLVILEALLIPFR